MLKNHHEQQVAILEGLDDDLNKLESKMKKVKQNVEQLGEEIELSNTGFKESHYSAE